jgi:hypothetical protein
MAFPLSYSAFVFRHRDRTDDCQVDPWDFAQWNALSDRECAVDGRCEFQSISWQAIIKKNETFA